MQPQLAIIIPAFKKKFFLETLLSIEQQIDKRFVLYIGNDGGDVEMENLVAEHLRETQYVYHYFDENLGGQSLVRHWERCIKMSSEPWVWLFSDDDIMAPDCVEEFYREIEQSGDVYDLYRFNTQKINEEGHVLSENPKHPRHESSYEFAIARLRHQRMSFAVEYIFSRKIFDRKGFIDFPLAWCSDDAVWISMGEEKGICTFGGGYVNWRYSTINISSAGSGRERERIRASLTYLKWLDVFFPDCRLDRKSMTDWMLAQARYHRGIIPLLTCIEIARGVSFGSVFRMIAALYELMKYNNRVAKGMIKKRILSRS